MGPTIPRHVQQAATRPHTVQRVRKNADSPRAPTGQRMGKRVAQMSVRVRLAAMAISPRRLSQ